MLDTHDVEDSELLEIADTLISLRAPPSQLQPPLSAQPPPDSATYPPGLGRTLDPSKLCVKISILRHRRMWVRSFSTRLTSVTFAEDKVLIFLILRKNAKILQL